jgi:16S rRNA (guanine527-N7)-methyltransferase
VEISQIAELLRPFLSHGTPDEATDVLSTAQLQAISTYIDLLLRWNSRINLTAVREPREIVTRHFGESLFAARCIFSAQPQAGTSVVDVGSGAGFPGLPIKIWVPQIGLSLLESNQKKSTFLREVVRALKLSDVQVLAVRAEDFSGKGDLVTLRAVEHFEAILPIAAGLVALGGRLAALIGDAQVNRATELSAGFEWGDPIPIPQSSNRVLMIGRVPG